MTIVYLISITSFSFYAGRRYERFLNNIQNKMYKYQREFHGY